jgi:hypothetical protein
MFAWFSSLFRRAEDASAAAFAPPDPAALYSQCIMSRSAARAALAPAKIPGPSELAHAEAEAERHVAARAADANAKFKTIFVEAETRCGELAVEAEADFAHAEAHAGVEEHRIQDDMQADLVAAFADVHIAETHIEMFKDVNGLSKEPQAPESLRRYLTLTMAMLLAETVLNLNAMAPAMEHGYAQAFLTAASDAGVNLGLAVLFAWRRRSPTLSAS